MGWMPDKRSLMTDSQERYVKFFGNQIKRDDALRCVDGILKAKGNFEGYADLTAGLDGIAGEYTVRIIDDDDSYNIVVEPIAGGEGLNFTIHKETGTLYVMPSKDKMQDVGDDDVDFLDGV
jgi:hypothetical protein